MKHVYKKIFYVIFAMISIFFSCETINADDGIVINRVGFNENGTGGGSSSCMSQWGACWNYPYNLGFRFTLIYASGENAGMKVDNTISVDFSSNEIFNKNSDKFIFGNNSNYHAHFGGRKYGYKYSDDFVNEKGEPYTVNDATDFVYAYVSGHSKPFESSNSLGIFLNNDFRMVRSTGWECDTDEGPEPCSFFDLFLHLCKFLDLDEVHYDDTTSKKDELKKYVILIEPTYSVEYKVYDSNKQDYVTLNRYGTINEIAKEMKKTTADDGFGLEAGLGRVLANNSLLCINNAQKTEYLSNFSRIKNPVERCNAGIAEGNVYDPYGKHKSTYISEIASSDFSRGMNIGVIPGVTGEFTLSARPLNNENFSFQLNSCNLFNENKISLSPTSNEPLSPEAILKENTKILKNEESADENQSVYCYDVVDYNFDDTVNYLNDHKFNRFTFINPPSSTAEVNRYCLLGATATYNVKSDLQSYKDNGIQLYFYGKEYDILPAESDIDVSEEIISNDLDISDTLSHYKYIRYSFELKYNYPKNTIYIGENYNQDYDSEKNMNQAYITLKKWKESFGRSNKLINTLGLDSLSTGNILSDFLVYKNYGQIDINKKNGENIKNDISCSIDYTIEKNKTNINFRVISLDNPFPARDGTSRMPAENWLYDENNVYEYITTNRGRVTEDVYRKVEKINEWDNGYGPMYSVTLSPSTMLKIRNYNKEYSYYSMYELGNYVSMTKDGVGKDDKEAYKLRCNNDGRECYSEFLRSEIFTQNSLIDGDCFLGRDTQDESKIRREFDEIFDSSGMSSSFIFTEDTTNEYVKRLFQGIDTEHAVTYNGDVNHNGRIDSEDLELMLSYADSYIYKTEAEEIEAQNNDEDYDASAAHISVKHNRYYTCANKTYKSGGPVKEAE